MNLSQFESPTPLYSGRGETALALAVLPLAFLHTLLECLYGSRAIPGQPWPYMLLLSGFSAVALGAVLFLATPAGDRLVRRLLAAKRLYEHRSAATAAAHSSGAGNESAIGCH